MGGRSSAKRIGPLYPRRNPWYSISAAEPTSGHMVLSGVPRKKSAVTPPGIYPGTVRLVAQRLNHYATPGPSVQTAAALKHMYGLLFTEAISVWRIESPFSARGPALRASYQIQSHGGRFVLFSPWTRAPESAANFRFRPVLTHF